MLPTVAVVVDFIVVVFVIMIAFFAGKQQPNKVENYDKNKLLFQRSKCRLTSYVALAAWAIGLKKAPNPTPLLLKDVIAAGIGSSLQSIHPRCYNLVFKVTHGLI
jgi:hypothetical protein